MPHPRTTVTELITGLGMLGYPDVTDALGERPGEMVSVSPELWGRLDDLYAGGALGDEFAASFANGAAFFASPDALRGRRPRTIEWKGSVRAPGDEVAPIDLRVDHVYLVSCKYLSKILHNSSPAHVFDGLLRGGQGQRGGDWFAEVAPREYAALYGSVRDHLDPSFPESPHLLSGPDRARVSQLLRAGWPPGADTAYEAMNEQVSQASAQRWQEALDEQGGPEAMFWRLLRMGSAPYFVLGVGPAGPLRLRVATPWDWRQQYRLDSFGVEAQAGGQARVAWHAGVKERTSGSRIEVHGHVEIRWSHGRFRGPPEAKVYLDTPHQGVPGYFPLDPGDGIGLRAATTAPLAAIADVEPLVLFAPDAAPDDPT